MRLVESEVVIIFFCYKKAIFPFLTGLEEWRWYWKTNMWLGPIKVVLVKNVGFLQMSNSDEEETMAIAHLQSIRQRRRPPHSKRRASRDSAAKVKMNSTWDQEMITEDAGSAKKMEEVMILKKAAAKMGVKQMSSTAYLSESEEEAMIMAQEKSISFLKDVTDTDLE